MELHNESAWDDISPLEREVRRRLWWTLYTSDKFVAQVFGRPAIIHDVDIHVNYPDMDDETIASQHSRSEDVFANGAQKPVASGSYHRYKAKLYEIATPITRGMYSRRDGAMSDTAEQIRTVHQQLLEWEKALPLELRLESFEDTQFNYRKGSLSMILHLQALALQASYDNIQLLLHRPLIVRKDFNKQSTYVNGITGDGRLQYEGNRGTIEDIIATSRRQCWSSALRMSFLVKHQGALEFVKSTPLGAHVGMHCFTAGVILAIFALSKPFSSQAQEAKQGVGRLIRIPTSSQSWTAIFSQSADILKDLLRLIMEKEMKALVEPSDQNDDEQGRPAYNDTPRNIESHAGTYYKSTDSQNEDSREILQRNVDFGSRFQSRNLGSVYQPDNIPPVSQAIPNSRYDVGDYSGSIANENFDEALSSLQNGRWLKAHVPVEFLS
ncbi:hypothetical protein NW764_016516 [Fusarium oxysporum]|nr:hypothetical protein NW764_016516 [Fusarium oxysporum]